MIFPFGFQRIESNHLVAGRHLDLGVSNCYVKLTFKLILPNELPALCAEQNKAQKSSGNGSEQSTHNLTIRNRRSSSIVAEKVTKH